MLFTNEQNKFENYDSIAEAVADMNEEFESNDNAECFEVKKRDGMRDITIRDREGNIIRSLTSTYATI